MTEGQPLLRPVEVQARYGISTAVQAQLRHRGDGWPYVKVGSRVYSRSEDIERWLRARTYSGTAQYS